jgi:hypothetical protein
MLTARQSVDTMDDAAARRPQLAYPGQTCRTTPPGQRNASR